MNSTQHSLVIIANISIGNICYLLYISLYFTTSLQLPLKAMITVRLGQAAWRSLSGFFRLRSQAPSSGERARD